MTRWSLLFVLTALYTCGAGVHPPGALHDWFEKQYSVEGAWCCDVSDGYLLEDNDLSGRELVELVRAARGKPGGLPALTNPSFVERLVRLP